jgi:SAM-dependent methyltransferase
MTDVRHPFFARFYVWGSAAGEKLGAAQHRDELLAGLEGRVLELGAGNGLNFSHYPATVTEVVAVEPEPYLRQRAVEEASRAPVQVRVVPGTADSLPAGDGELDAVVASLVLCSVPSQERALAELRRVLRPGGELRFYEHVLAEDATRAQRQRRLDPVWTRLVGGCHLDRDTVAAIEQAGFELAACRRFDFVSSFLTRPAAPHVVGRAVKP